MFRDRAVAYAKQKENQSPGHAKQHIFVLYAQQVLLDTYLTRGVRVHRIEIS